MTIKQTREQFLLALNSNAYLNMCTTDDMKNVIKALDKQIPKKPKVQVRGVYNDDSGDWVCDEEWYMCPSCQMRNEVYPTWKLCHHCGQMLDWLEMRTLKY